MSNKRKASVAELPQRQLPDPYSFKLESKIPPTNTTVYDLAEMCAPKGFSSRDIHEGIEKTSWQKAQLVLNIFSEYCGKKTFEPPYLKLAEMARQRIPIVRYDVTEEDINKLGDTFTRYMNEWLSESETEDYHQEEKRKAVIDALWTNLREALDMDNSNFQAASDLFNYLPYCKKEYCISWAQDWATNNIDAYETPLSKWEPGDKISCVPGMFQRLFSCLPTAFGVRVADEDASRQKRLFSTWVQRFNNSPANQDYIMIEEPTEQDKARLTQEYRDFLETKIQELGENPKNWDIETHLDDENGIKLLYGGRRRRKNQTKRRNKRSSRKRRHLSRRR